MPVSFFTRTELRKRHPGLKIRNNADLDHAIQLITTLAYGDYLINGAHPTDFEDRAAAAVKILDAPAKAALIDYLSRLKEVAESL